MAEGAHLSGLGCKGGGAEGSGVGEVVAWWGVFVVVSFEPGGNISG